MKSPNQLPSRNLLSLLLLPMSIALGVSGYLTWASLTSSPIAGCSGGEIFDCGHVLYSKWSKLAGVPVSALALLTYVAMLFATVVARTNFSARVRQHAWTAVTGLAIAASLAAVWFIYLQVFVLQHLCQYCLVAHGCGIAIAIIALARCRPSMPRLAPVASLAATGLGVMIAIQVNAEPPKTYTIQEYVPVTYATASSEDIELRGIDEEDAFAPPVEDDDFLLPPGEDVGEDVVFAPPSEDVL